MRLRRRLREWVGRRLAAWARRRQGEDRLPLIVSRPRLYILPTRAGMGLGVLLTFMLLAGLNYGNNLALLATFFMMGFMLVAMNLCHRNLQNLRIVAATTRPGFAGAQGQIELTLDAGGNQSRWAVEAECDDASDSVSLIEADGSSRIRLELPTPRRGVQHPGRIKLSTTFPYGLFRAWTWLHLPLEIVVYPHPAGSRAMPAARDGMDTGVAHGGTGLDEWSGIRPFRDGDSPRQVIWTAYARELPLLVKEYTGTAADWMLFDFEQLTGLETEQRLQQICRWILDAEQRGLRYALRLPVLTMDPDGGQAHRDRALRALALFPGAGAAP